MSYSKFSKTWYDDESFYVMGIRFSKDATDQEIEQTIKRHFSKEVLESRVATREVICRYLDPPQYVVERMIHMPIGSSFEFKGIIITRWSDTIYNGRPV